MKAFISYSHKDAHYLEKLKTHLAQIKRDGLLTEWTDHEIIAGSNLNSEISSALSDSQLFILLVSPDYIASHYCYEREFATALELQEQGQMTIVPIIVEPCDWKSTPMKELKALPEDGKPVSEWTNSNNAFAKVAEEIRKLLNQNLQISQMDSKIPNIQQIQKRNYRAERIFTEVDKIDFREKGFNIVKDYFKAALSEFNGIENLQGRFLDEENKYFSCLISNKGNLKDSYITISIAVNNGFGYGDLGYSFSQNNAPNTTNLHNIFSIENDKYEMFWSYNKNQMFGRTAEKLSAKDIAEIIWDRFIAEIGVS